VERPFSYIRKDFFLARTFRNLDDLNVQLDDWLATVAKYEFTARHSGLSPRPSQPSRQSCSRFRPCHLTNCSNWNAA
jgi:hypothetical protein